MHDLVFRHGTVIDGTGIPGRRADVAIDDGLITAVEPRIGTARRDIDADGLLVLPGWVDIHTHYDGQATWDAEMTPSSWHGVTTTIFGNCGVGFAPVRPGTETFLINLMEGVEDIPEIVLAEGVDFRWESFNDAESNRRVPLDSSSTFCNSRQNRQLESLRLLRVSHSPRLSVTKATSQDVSQGWTQE